MATTMNAHLDVIFRLMTVYGHGRVIGSTGTHMPAKVGLVFMEICNTTNLCTDVCEKTSV